METAKPSKGDLMNSEKIVAGVWFDEGGRCSKFSRADVQHVEMPTSVSGVVDFCDIDYFEELCSGNLSGDLLNPSKLL